MLLSFTLLGYSFYLDRKIAMERERRRAARMRHRSNHQESSVTGSTQRKNQDYQAIPSIENELELAISPIHTLDPSEGSTEERIHILS